MKKRFVEVEYLRDHGSYKKGETSDMHSTTAEALVQHGVVKIGKTVPHKKDK